MQSGGPLGEALLELDAITRRLRRECPWDREQDERSIVPHTVEEAYELADAAHAGDHAKLLDELGDVLFQVYFLALLLEERGEGDLAEVARGCAAKLVRRHPHIFGADDALDSLPTDARTPEEVRRNWDEIKRSEPGRGGAQALPGHLPALTYARKLQRRVRRRAPAPRDALEHLERQAAAAVRAIDDAGGEGVVEGPSGHGSARSYEMIGELLLAAVELSRALEVDAEIALRSAADRLGERARGDAA